MERRSLESRLNSIRGKIWTMVILLAVTNCVSCAIVFVAASLLTTDTWIPVVLSITVSTVTTFAFAWWISRDVLRPVDKLNLLAKSIERSPGMSVPKTTGASETDDILHSISRASRQLTNFIDLMDEVTAGNTQAALDSLEHSDRLSESFQKLVAKVTDSIDAKAELSELQLSINQISAELSGLTRGESVRIRNEFPATRTITDALRFLIERHGEITHTVGSNSTEIRTLLIEVKGRVESLLETELARERRLGKLMASIADLSSRSEQAIGEIAESIAAIPEALSEIEKNPSALEENVKSQAAMRKQFETAIHKLSAVGKQSLAITHVARSVQDLAKRSNIIALNASLQANGENVPGLATLTQEIAALSERAEKANKAIAGISDSVVRDVNESNASIQWISTEVGTVSKRVIHAEETLENVGAILRPLAEYPAQIEIAAAERTVETGRTLQLLEELSSRSSEMVEELRVCEATLGLALEPLELVREAIASRKQLLSPIETLSGDASETNGSAPKRPSASEIITLPGE